MNNARYRIVPHIGGWSSKKYWGIQKADADGSWITLYQWINSRAEAEVILWDYLKYRYDEKGNRI